MKSQVVIGWGITVVLLAQLTNAQVTDRFSVYEADLQTASGDSWSLLLKGLCREAKTEQQQKRASVILERQWNKADQFTLASSLRALATNSPDSLRPFEAKIAELLNTSDDLTAILELILAIRTMSGSTAEVQSALKRHMSDHRYVIAIQASVASVALNPDYDLAVNKVNRFLARPEAEIVWRTAISLGGIGEKSARWIDEFEKLTKHTDVRVRVAAAFAIWRSKHDAAQAVPVLVEALKQQNLPMPQNFVYPSNTGGSHRVFAVQALGEMGPQAASVVPVLKQFVKDADREYPGKDWNQEQDSMLGLTSLVSLASIATPNPELADELEKSTSRDGSIFKMISHTTTDALKQLRAGAK